MAEGFSTRTGLSGLLIIVSPAVRTLPRLKPQLLFTMLFAVVKLKAPEGKKEKRLSDVYL